MDRQSAQTLAEVEHVIRCANMKHDDDLKAYNNGLNSYAEKHNFQSSNLYRWFNGHVSPSIKSVNAILKPLGFRLTIIEI